MIDYNKFDFWHNGPIFPFLGGNVNTNDFDFWSNGSIYASVSIASGYQYSFAVSDVSNTGWSIEPLYTGIQEEAPDDSNYIFASKRATNDTCKIQFSGLLIPSGLPVDIDYRYRKYPGVGGSLNFSVSLYNGGVYITGKTYTLTDTVENSTWITGGLSLNQEAYNLISDWSNLSLEFKAT